jgi:hypothetical protein
VRQPGSTLTRRDRWTLRRIHAKEAFWRWLAWKLPGPLVYWASVRLVTRATSGSFEDTIVPDLTAMEALQRWELVDRRY